jgi:hypothetical protein
VTSTDDAERVARLTRVRRFFVVLGLVLFVVSLTSPLADLVFARSAAWAVAAVVAFVEMSLAKRAGVPGPRVVYPIVYLLVAALPFAARLPLAR